MPEHWWSLKKASIRFGLPERELRESIASGDMVGIPRDTPGDWLVRESDLLVLRRHRGVERAPSSVRSGGPRPIFPLLLAIVLGALILGGGLISLSGEYVNGCYKLRATQAILKSISGQIDLFQFNHGRYPSSLQELVMRPKDIAPDDWPPGGYLPEASATLDAWGREIVYRLPFAEGQAYDLLSLGDPGNPDQVIWARVPPRMPSKSH
jgi:type II secretory pathway pseudopilin PulG